MPSKPLALIPVKETLFGNIIRKIKTLIGYNYNKNRNYNYNDINMK